MKFETTTKGNDSKKNLKKIKFFRFVLQNKEEKKKSLSNNNLLQFFKKAVPKFLISS